MIVDIKDRKIISEINYKTEHVTNEWNLLTQNFVAGLIKDIGFQMTSDECIDAMVYVILKYLQNIAFKAQKYAEHASRCKISLTDIEIVMVDLGISFESLLHFRRRHIKCSPPTFVPIPVKPKRFHFGIRMPTTQNIENFLPEFPPLHTYQETKISEQDIDFSLIERKNMSCFYNNKIKQSIAKYAIQKCGSIDLFPNTLDYKVAIPLKSTKPYNCLFGGLFEYKKFISDDTHKINNENSN
ncbi:TBP-associated factor 8 [Intoshia linei]|uniref:Transcription initiation factor TFIID subunit 8 n=1 Tax=Intoshia linei TaxID=1819745 RepID=A0A177B6W6_9BILA|nr:TBP-associated factor 8 [Intoshia linei]